MNQQMIRLVQEDCERSCADSTSFNALRGQTVLMTGGTGFMGKWVSEMISYLNEKHDSQIKLILLARDIEKFRIEVPHLAKKSFIRLIEHDVRNLHDLPDETSWVIHAAGTPDNREHASQPIRTVETIDKGTRALLDACFRLPDLRKLLHISSHQVYGNFNMHIPISEKDMGCPECNSVNNAYSESKRMAETLCAIYRNQQRLPITIIRPFAFIGPYQYADKPWAINNFIRDGLLGGPVRILGNGETVRSYLYGSDLAYWLLKALVDGKTGETYNIGSQESISLNALAANIVSMIDKKIEIVSKSSRETYASFSVAVPNTAKIRKDTGVSEVFNLDEALKRTLQWNTENNKTVK